MNLYNMLVVACLAHSSYAIKMSPRFQPRANQNFGIKNEQESLADFLKNCDDECMAKVNVVPTLSGGSQSTIWYITYNGQDAKAVDKILEDVFDASENAALKKTELKQAQMKLKEAYGEVKGVVKSYVVNGFHSSTLLEFSRDVMFPHQLKSENVLRSLYHATPDDYHHFSQDPKNNYWKKEIPKIGADSTLCDRVDFDICSQVVDQTHKHALPENEVNKLLSKLQELHNLKENDLVDDSKIFDRPYAVYPYMQQGDLSNILKEGKFDNQQKLQCIKDMFKVVQEMKAFNMRHRDIKLNNIFVTNDNKCVLADFGHAIRSEDISIDTQKGTFGFWPRDFFESGAMSFGKFQDEFAIATTGYCLMQPQTFGLWHEKVKPLHVIESPQVFKTNWVDPQVKKATNKIEQALETMDQDTANQIRTLILPFFTDAATYKKSCADNQCSADYLLKVNNALKPAQQVRCDPRRRRSSGP